MLAHRRRIEGLISWFRERRILLAIPFAVMVNLLILTLFLALGGKDSSALDGTSEEPIERPSSPAAGKKGPRRGSLPVKSAKVRPPAASSGPVSPEPTGTIKGRVVAEEARFPLAGALVRLVPDLPRSLDERIDWSGSVSTDGTGSFRIDGLRHAPYRLRASAPGRLDAGLSGVLPGQGVEIALPSDPGIPCRLEAKDASSADPLPGQNVLIEIPTEGWALEASTDPQGSFLLTGIAREGLEKAMHGGRVEILVPGFSEPSLAESPPGFVITVNKGITVYGVVLEKSTGRPIPAASVRTGSGHSVETDGSGAYRIAGVSESLAVLAPGFAPECKGLLDLDAEGKESLRVEFQMDRGVGLRGRVCDSWGNGLPGVKVTVMLDVLDFALSDPRLTALMKKLLSSTSDGAGNYRIAGIPAGALSLPGTLFLEVRPPGLEKGVIQEVDVKVDSGEAELPIVLDIAGPLSGTLAGDDGKALAGARVSVLSMEEGVSQVSATDGQGTFEFRNLPAGTYQLTAEAPDLQALTKEITVPSKPLRLILKR